MKNLCITIGLVCGLTFFNNLIFAQGGEETKVLFSKGEPISQKDIGFFLSPSFGFTQKDGSGASLINLRGGVGLRNKLFLGAWFNTSINEIRPQSETLPNIYLDYWSAGGFLEYTFLSKKIVHFSFPLYLGYGEVEMDNENDDIDLGEANFLVIEPSALVEINLHKYIRLNIGTGYRFIGEMRYRNFNQSDISGFTVYAGLKFGLFR